MELVYPFVIYIGIPILFGLLFFKFHKKNLKFKEGKKIANTKYVKNTPYYQDVLKKYKMLTYWIEGLCVVSIVLALVLIARPVVVEQEEAAQYNRDIFLCLDVSSSVDELNEQLVKNLKEVVNNLKGERFGISIFNTSSVLLVPLTDDYEYVNSVLDTLQKCFNIINTKNFKNSDYLYLLDYIQSGTLVGNEQKGSSITGDALASCVYNFSNLEEDRTRVILFSTDNDLAGEPMISLQQAAQLSKEKKITVYGIAPEQIQSQDKEELEKAVKTTGGELYIQSDKSTVPTIINNIQEKQKTLMKGQQEKKQIGKPEIPFILLIFSLFVLFILNKRVKL